MVPSLIATEGTTMINFLNPYFLFSSYIPIQSQLIEISHDKEIENNEYLYEFIKENLKGKKILADYKYGFFIQSVGAISMLDQDFYKLKNSQKILTDIKIFYYVESQSEWRKRNNHQF